MTARTATPFEPGQPMPLVLDAYQASYLLGMDYEHVLGLLKSGLLGSLPYKSGTRWLVPVQAAQDYITDNMLRGMIRHKKRA